MTALISYSFSLTKPRIQFQTAVYGKGDSMGKSESAVTEAIEQAGKQVTGSIRAKLYALQETVGSQPEVDCPLSHVFAPGAVARTIFIPAGTTVVGKIHKHKHLNILSQGEVSVVTENGGVEHFKGPLTMVSEPGTKRALYAHTDLVWTVIHVTNETDLGLLEKEVIAESYEDYSNYLLTHEPKH
jgi:hypothetical protein